MIEEGTPAPDFELQSDTGETVKLSDFRGRPVVLGVSPDNVTSHGKFKSKHHLPFTLLADPDHTTAEAYGVWGERKFAGRKYMGINRSTFLIDASGNVVRALIGIKPAGHAAQVLEQLPA